LLSTHTRPTALCSDVGHKARQEGSLGREASDLDALGCV
jgi:hypothetical protein